MHKPIIGITMGDGAGVGPEIIIKALCDKAVYEQCRPLVIGDAKLLRRAASIVKAQIAVTAIDEPAEGQFRFGTVDCIDLDMLPADLPFGQISAEAGNAAFHYLKKAVELALSGQIDAICTAPLKLPHTSSSDHRLIDRKVVSWTINMPSRRWIGHMPY
jgi:4-hydroxy-L-threonine phosphate dehydrogenase PdxA